MYPSTNNSILSLVDLFDKNVLDIDTPPTAANSKPNVGGGKQFYKCRQKNDATKHISFSKVRKRRRPS